MAKKIYVSFILDETGSMSVVQEQTISGFNEYIQTLKSAENADKTRFSLTKFNSEKVDIVYDGVKLNKVENLTRETYQPEAMTPLYDAIGQTINALELKLGDKKCNVLIVIQTDGQENASKEFNANKIFELIEEKKKEGWTFVFLGADQDAFLTGQTLGIPRASTLSYNSANTKGTFRRTAIATAHYTRSGGLQTNEFFTDSESE